MPPAAAAAAGRLATYVLTPSVAVPLVRLPRRCGRARRFDSASYGSPLVSLGLATVSFFNNLLVALCCSLLTRRPRFGLVALATPSKEPASIDACLRASGSSAAIGPRPIW